MACISEFHWKREYKLGIEAIHTAYQENPTIDPLVIVECLRNWIENHMLALDMDYKEFMVKLEAKKKIQQPPARTRAGSRFGLALGF